MSWGYWGIVTGLVALVATFFVCMRLVYSDTERPSNEPRCPTDQPAETGQATSAGSRLAA